MRDRLALLGCRCGFGKPIGHKGSKAISSVWRRSPLRGGSQLIDRSPYADSLDVSLMRDEIELGKWEPDKDAQQ